MQGYAQDASSKKFYQKAKDLKEKGRWQEALSQFLLASKYDSTWGDPRWEAGVVQFENAGPDPACLGNMAAYFRLEKNADATRRYEYGQALQRFHRFEDAIAEYKSSDPKKRNLATVAQRVRECENGIKYLASPQPHQISLAGQYINTPYNEYLPYVTADQMVIFYTSRRPGPYNKKGDAMHEDVYFCQNKSGEWSRPALMPEPVNTTIDDACVGISHDGQVVFIYKGSGKGDLYIAEKRKGKWQKPYKFEHNMPNSKESGACISADGRRLFFTSDRAGSQDIYMCVRTPKGPWGQPKRLSTSVNSSQDEESPFIDAAGNWLYFASKGHTTMGGYDIFRAALNLSDAVGAPQNLGSPLNTAGDELSFSIAPDGKFGYYSSSRQGGLGGQDIYKARLPAQYHAHGVALLAGVVKDGANGGAVEADVTVTDNETQKTVAVLKSDAEDGRFSVAVPAGKDYGIVVEKEGRLFYSDRIKTGADGFTPTVRAVSLPALEKGAKVNLQNLFFDVSKADLRPESFPELDRVVGMMKKYTQVRIGVSGHTDNTGNPEANLALSKQRAEAVKTYLTGKGIAQARVQTQGFGSTRPVADNATEAGKQMNRRTEVSIL